MDKPYFVHASAYVDEPCEIGEGTKVWHFSHVMPKCKLGKKCILGQNVHIATGVIIGDNVKIQNNVSLYDGAVIQDDVFLGPSCVFTNVTNPRSQIVRRSMYEKTLVRRGASVGANSTIVCGTTIGRYAFIAAGAVVTKDVPDYALIIGVPGRIAGWMSRHGYRLGAPDANGIMLDPETGWKYKVAGNVVTCLNLGEDEPLPA
ncbi:MAG TPA: acyltransferase [Gemmataceae bacterium]|jgi:UDP-2-acetamido-3-amino-2,3-dideoxy-glucuronate N-acetyltransferase|nr:acyltransferase [Gemmataceae bacterium]